MSPVFIWERISTESPYTFHANYEISTKSLHESGDNDASGPV